jgi:hypothetical protein
MSAKLTLGALAELEAALETGSLLDLVERFEERRFSTRDVLALIVAGLRGGGWQGSAAICCGSRSAAARSRRPGRGRTAGARLRPAGRRMMAGIDWPGLMPGRPARAGPGTRRVLAPDAGRVADDAGAEQTVPPLTRARLAELAAAFPDTTEKGKHDGGYAEVHGPADGT